MTSKRPTADDVARAAGVSRATVSFVLNQTPGQTISPAVREKVQAQAARLGYVPHHHARALASGQSHLIVVPLPDWPIEHLVRQLLDEASTVLDEAGYSLVPMETRRSGNASPLWESLRPDVVMPFAPLPQEQVDAILRSGTRLASPSSAATHPTFDVGPELQTQHLIDLGHSSIAYASTPVQGFESMDSDRCARARTVAERHGVRFTSSVVDETNAEEAVRAWAASDVTGVVAFNDETAARVVGGAYRQKIAVPADLAVVGHDDSPIARLVVPSLTTISIDAAGLGRHFAHRALAIARGEAVPPLDPPGLRATLVRREST